MFVAAFYPRASCGERVQTAGERLDVSTRPKASLTAGKENILHKKRISRRSRDLAVTGGVSLSNRDSQAHINGIEYNGRKCNRRERKRRYSGGSWCLKSVLCETFDTMFIVRTL